MRDTVRSAAGGSYSNIEIIIVDDGSTDATASVAEELAGGDPRITLVRRENGGLSAALNSGFSVAKGDYIARLDADDLWHPSKLAKQVAFALDHPDAAFIYTFARYIDERDRVLHDGPRQEFPPHALCRGIYESIVGGGSSALLKRSAVEQAGGCDESLRSWEDMLLQLAISARHPIGFVPEYLVGYRTRPGSLSKDIDAMVRGWRTVRARLQAQFPHVPAFVHAWAHGTRCAMFAEGYAWRRQPVRSGALLAEAMRHDPTRLFEFLRMRIARRRTKARMPAQQSPPITFLDCDPAQVTRLDAFEHYPAYLRFFRFEQRRRQRLRELDERLARKV